MTLIQELNIQRDSTLKKISEIRRMRRGTITTTRPIRKRKDGSTYQAGPYYKHQSWEDGHNHTVYLTADQFTRLQPDVENYHALLSLTDELAGINERLTLLEQTDPVMEEKKTSLPKPPKRN